MTYYQLLSFLQSLSDDQLNMDITVEVGGEDLCSGECYAGLACISQHDSLDDNHPVIFVK